MPKQQYICPKVCKDLVPGSDFLRENEWNVIEWTRGSNICVKLPFTVQNGVRGKRYGFRLRGGVG